MRQRLLTRMGAEGEDALDAFLAEALASEGRDVRDLETFVARLSASDIEVKREQEDARLRAGGMVAPVGWCSVGMNQQARIGCFESAASRASISSPSFGSVGISTTCNPRRCAACKQP